MPATPSDDFPRPVLVASGIDAGKLMRTPQCADPSPNFITRACAGEEV